VALQLAIRGDFDFDPGKCSLAMKIDEQEVWKQEFVWQDGKKYHFDVSRELAAGEHRITFGAASADALRAEEDGGRCADSVGESAGTTGRKEVGGDEELSSIFPKDAAPDGVDERRAYAREVLAAFAKKAYRRPLDERTLSRLVKIAEEGYGLPGKNLSRG